MSTVAVVRYGKKALANLHPLAIVSLPKVTTPTNLARTRFCSYFSLRFCANSVQSFS